MKLIRITNHPTDADIVVLKTPPDLAGDMGRFEPARYAADLRAYLTHRDTIEALRRFAKYVGAHVVDDRPSDGERALAHECANCARAGSVNNPPTYCPECGEPWTPITHHESEPSLTMGTCTACHRKQSQRFPRCAHCGGAMAYPAPGKPVQLPRRKLADPMPFADAIAETLPTLAPSEDA